MINLTKVEYQNSLKNSINSNEAHVFLNPKNKEKMIKIIKKIVREPDYFSIKMYTISLLLKHKDILSRLKVAMPEEKVLIDDIEMGYQTRKINGRLLEDVLEDPNISLDTKIGYFKQVGGILRTMGEIRDKTSLKNLFYVDIHEGNFIVDKNDILYGIDPDSFSILDNTPTSGYYSGELYDLFPDSRKYQFCDIVTESATDVIPDENLDLYCYIRMIINFMCGDYIDNLTPELLFDYLDFLEYYGANLDFLYSLESIYDDSKPNINPDYLLDYIKEIYEYANINYDKSGHLSRILK